MDAAAQPLLRAAMQRLQLSARAFHRVLKLARTIADLACAAPIGAAQLAEAIHHRVGGLRGVGDAPILVHAGAVRVDGQSNLVHAFPHWFA